MRKLAVAIGSSLILFLVSMSMAYCDGDFELELFIDEAVEGQNIVFNVSVLNPSVANAEIEPYFVSPDGVEVPFMFPPPKDSGDRRPWVYPAIPPATGRVNGSEEASLKNVQGETKFEWRTAFNGRVGKVVVDEEEAGNWTLKVRVTGIDFSKEGTIDETLTADFNITKIYSQRNPKFIIFGLSILTSMFTSVATYFMVDQNKAKAVKEKVSAMQKEIMDAQRSGDKKRIMKAKKKQTEMMALQSEMMRNQFKPMIIYMIPLFAVFYFLRSQYDMVPVAELPFKLGFMQFFHQNNPISPDQFGFIAWYFATATWFGTIFRKIIGVV